MNLYDQLCALQLIKNAYNNWQPYRSQLTQYILQHLPANSNVTILGAGCCNDLDLKLLISHFNQITLIDKNKTALKTALEQYELTDCPRIQLCDCSFLAITDEDYRRYADLLTVEIRKQGLQTDCLQFAQFANALLEQLLQKALLKPDCFSNMMFENVVIVGVHSQLLSMLEWIWHIMLQTLQKDEATVRQTIVHMNNQLITLFNESLIKHTQNTLILGCETRRLAISGSIQGAAQALNDIQLRLDKGQLVLEDATRLIWPFDLSQHIEYEVQLLTLNKVTH